MASKQADKAEALYQEARTTHLAGNVAEAIGLYEQALENHPQRGHVQNDLGVALRATGRPRAAIALYRRALDEDPKAADTWSNLANALAEIEESDEALGAMRNAERLEPDNPLYIRSLGILLRETGFLPAAAAQFERVLQIEPDSCENRFQLGLTQLQQGRIRDGFGNYEARFGAKRVGRRDFAAPIWNGDPLDGRTLLVHAEQGMGDMLQFARFLRQLPDRAGGTVVGEVHPPLLRLFASSFPEVEFVAVGALLPMHDVTVSLISLPHRLGLDADDIASRTPYLWPGSDIAQAVVRLPDNGRPKIGLTWAGKKLPSDRSCPFEAFLGLAEVAGADFYSLQRGEEAADIKAHGAAALVSDLGSRLGDFADDAALMPQLDLVISIDTATCHLAGATGTPCWTLLKSPADWRYPVSGESTPWYPAMRLFRGGLPHDWRAQIATVKAALTGWVSAWHERSAFGMASRQPGLDTLGIDPGIS